MSNKNLDPKLLKPVATFYQMELESNIFQITDHNSFTIPIELHFKKINHLMAKESNSNESMNINPSGMFFRKISDLKKGRFLWK